VQFVASVSIEHDETRTPSLHERSEQSQLTPYFDRRQQVLPAEAEHDVTSVVPAGTSLAESQKQSPEL
jgi:hypothetical protein